MVEISDKEYQKLQTRLKELEVAVAERKLAEESLKLAEAQYGSLTENSPDLIARFDRQLRHLYVNPAAAKSGRYSPEEYIGKTIREVGVPEQEAKKWEQHIRTAFETGQLVDVEDTFTTPQGLKYFNTKFAPERASDGTIRSVLSIARDITERKRVEEEIKKSEEFFKGVTENASDVIIIVDRKGIIKYISPSAERFLGYKQEELIGRKGFDFIQPIDIPRALIDFAKAITIKDAAIPNSFHLRHKDGSVRIFEGLGKNLFNNPAVAGFVMNAHDITERKRAEDELRKKVGELEIYYKASMGREDKILELKKQIEKLQK